MTSWPLTNVIYFIRKDFQWHWGESRSPKTWWGVISAQKNKTNEKLKLAINISVTFSGQEEVVCKAVWGMINHRVTQRHGKFLVSPFQKTTGKPKSIHMSSVLIQWICLNSLMLQTSRREQQFTGEVFQYLVICLFQYALLKKTIVNVVH